MRSRWRRGGHGIAAATLAVAVGSACLSFAIAGEGASPPSAEAPPGPSSLPSASMPPTSPPPDGSAAPVARTSSSRPAPPPPSAGDAAAAGVRRALELHDEARRLYARGQYPEAVAKLEEAVQLDPAAILLHYNLGLIEEKRGRLPSALGHYRRALALEEKASERAHLMRIIKRLEGARVRDALGPEARPSGARVAAATPLEGRAPRDVRRRRSWGSGLEVAAYASGGGALLCFATASVLALRASALDPGSEAQTTPDVGVDRLVADAAAAQRFAVGADVMIGVGAAAAVAAVTLGIVVSIRDDEDGDRARSGGAWSVVVGPLGGRVVGAF
ncbi:MAG: tetratricopeptide repeat protein [Myxococcota bacterium]